nr:type II secretion system protein GspG [Halanaerobacter jeridensis]
MTGVRGKANVSAVQSEFKSIQTSMEMYYIDNGKYPNSLSALQTGGYASSEQIQDINNTDYDNAGSIANGGEGKLSNPNGVAVDYKLQYNVPNSGGTIVTLETNNGVTVTN